LATGEAGHFQDLGDNKKKQIKFLCRLKTQHNGVIFVGGGGGNVGIP